MRRNEDQSRFWNDGPGGKTWSARADDLDQMHESVTELLLETIAPEPGMRILDVGCGAGATSLTFAKHLAPEGEVVGLDFARPLIELARERAEARGISNVSFRIDDAQSADLGIALYDAVISRFGLMFFEDPVAAFRNIHTCLKPRARIVFVAWAGADQNPWFGEARAAAEEHFGPAKPTPPDAPGPIAFAEIDRVLGILERSGFEHRRGEARDIELFHPGGLQTILQLAKVIGPIPGYLRENEGTKADLAAILNSLGKRFCRMKDDNGITLPARVNIFEARATT
ncbi:class I SAM-dependent methyltransferase [Amaricoccus macauensis]|uniref:class I SAM-dependent methyltransferase n=1 Tax=Amaricoccus macauensis TaxID=57001 RepID=UPI003C7E5379